MLRIRLREMEVDAQHGIQQGVFVRCRLERVSRCVCRVLSVDYQGLLTL